MSATSTLQHSVPNSKWPRGLIWSVMAVCVIPLALNGLGFDFGSAGAAFDAEVVGELPPAERADYLHRALCGSFTHTLLEWSAFCVALFTAVLAWVHFSMNRRDAVTPVIGMALFFAGCMDAFHTLAADRLIYGAADPTNLIPFTWALCRLFNVVIMVVGITVVLRRQGRQHETSILYVTSTTFVLGLIAYAAIHACSISDRLPQTMFPDKIISRPYDVVPLVLFLLAGATVYRRLHRASPGFFTYGLMLSLVPDVVTQLHMAFGSSALFDNHFNIAHFLKIVSYLVPLVGLILDYNQTYRSQQYAVKETKLANSRMRFEIVEREKTEIQLERQAAEADLMHRVADLAAESDSFEDALQQCVDLICETTHWPLGHVYLRTDVDPDELVPADIWHVPDNHVYQAFQAVTMRTSFGVGEGLPGRILASGRPEWIHNVKEDEYFSRVETCSEIDLKGALGFPVNIGGRTIAVLEFFSDVEDKIDDNFLALMQNIGGQLGRIVERKLAEEKAAFLSALVESSDDAIVGKTFEGTITSWNVAAEKLYGFTAEEALGEHISLIVPPYRQHEIAELLQQVQWGERVEHFDTLRQKKDGSLIDVSLTVSPINSADGEIIGASAIARNIADRKRAEEKAARLLAIVESASDAIVSLGLDGSILTWNPAAEKMLGYSGDEVVGKSFSMLMSADCLAEEMSFLTNIIEGEPFIRCETVRLCKDGSSIDVELTMSSIHNASGRVTAISTTARDVSEHNHFRDELARYARQLQEQNRALDRSNQELDDFAYVASHDLKEPLRGIHNYSNFLLEDYADQLDDDGRSKLETLTRLTQRMESLINSLLHFSRVGRTELAIGPIDLQAIFADVVDSLHIRLQELEVEVRFPRPLPTIVCDASRIGEVFRNLITNAMKYNDKPDKFIEIGYQMPDERDGSALTHAGEHLPDNCALFYVRDNGIGIREQHIDQVFRIFKRLHGRDKFGGGTGAGLTIVKKIVERHNGRIWIESTFGEGCTFYFTLPVLDFESDDGQPQIVEPLLAEAK